MTKSSQVLVNVVLKLECTVQLVIVFDVHLPSMKDADHDAGGLLNEVRQSRAHALNCTAMSAMNILKNASVFWKHTVKLNQLCHL